MESLWAKFQHRWRGSATSDYEQLDAKERLFSISSGSEDSIDTTLEKYPLAAPNHRTLKHDNRAYWLFTCANILILGITGLVASTRFMEARTPTQDICLKQTSMHSPILEGKSIGYKRVQLNGTLWPGVEPAWSRREPGDAEGEAKWESFEWMPVFPITGKDVAAMGKDPALAARFPDEVFGLGDDAYVASLDIQHKIHCVNELRKMSFADYGEDTPTKKGHGRLWWVHLRHCVDMLAQDLICHADAELITYQWRDTQPIPFPDFGINRQCRDFEPLFEYRDEHIVDMTKFNANRKKPKEDKVLPMEPGYYVAYGFGKSEMYPNGTGYDGPWPSQDGWYGYPPTPDPLYHINRD